MREFMNITAKLFEGEVVPFTGNNRPTNNLAVAQGGAEVMGFPQHVSMDDFTSSYVGCALWSSTGDDGEPLDDEFDNNNIASPSLKQMAEDCKDFQESYKELLDQAYASNGYDENRAGHDFWLTRNRHGAGFWDRGLGLVGKELTQAAHAYGESNLYIGDDGMLHIS